MAKKDTTFKGKTVEELQEMKLGDFMNLVPSRTRRTLKRGFTEEQKKLLLKVKKAKEGKYKKQIKTHCRNMIVLPEMVGQKIAVHTGKEFSVIDITYEMLGRYLGELTLTRKRVAHNDPGIGATKSSASRGVK